MTEPMTYASAGVDYDAMDPFKREATKAAISTSDNIGRRLGFQVHKGSYGESAFLIESVDGIPYVLSHVEEGLGTKNLIADAMYKLTGKSYYDQIGQDGVAMIVNDLITSGALPLSVAMHLAVGASDWFDDINRRTDLIEGWKQACNLARCVWGGGETPTLKGIVEPGTAVISGSATGAIKPVSRLIDGSKIADGDTILIAHSSGIHANGLTLARKIADKLPNGYLTKLPDGRTYGETLLDPTVIYVDLIESCFMADVHIHYAVNVTGHGWRKLMRANGTFEYYIDTLPPELPIFPFIQKYGPMSDEEAYGNLNMGAGFALILPMSDAIKVWKQYPGQLTIAGCVKKSDKKKVVIDPKGIEFTADTLQVR